MNYLEKINTPEDLKKLNKKELSKLCNEIRKFIEKVIFKTGGHLSSNLGVVELTIALHYVYNFLTDKLIFDVSHQAYTHKIITGRKADFPNIRQYKGLSGYTNPAESSYDNFMFAHAGTSISTSLGMASAKKIKKEKGKIITIIGDASISVGMALEGINHAGHINENILVILNDNCMSISPTVGSFSTYLQNIRMNSSYQEMKKDFKQFLKKIPVIGKPFKEGLGHLLEIIKHQCMDGKIGHIFEELNFKYYGPIDGHNLELLIDSLNSLKLIKGPILLHVITDKGKGHNEALNNPEKYHGIAPYKNKKCIFSNSKINKISFTEAFSNSLIKLAKKDEKIIGITAAMPGGTGLNQFQKHFPKRYFDVGICEQHAMGFAAGQSVEGLKPVCAIYSTFLQRCYDQIFQEVCLNNNPVVMILDRAGISGQDGATHAGVFDIAYLRCLPNIILMAPRNSFELQQMLEFALKLNSPVAIRIPKDDCNQPFQDNFPKAIELGKGQILQEKNSDELILIAYGVMANTCLEVLEKLSAQKIEVSVINARFAKPLDTKLFKYLFNKNKPIITIEEHSKMGGFGSAVLELASQLNYSGKINILGIPDSFTNHGSRKEILKELELDSDGIVNYIKSKIFQKKEKSSIYMI